MRLLPAMLIVSIALTMSLLSACTATEGKGAEGDPDSAAPELTGCGPPRFRDVVGRAPRYLDPPLASTPNEHALCGGAWLPRTSGPAFVPQGLVVRDGIAWVSGYGEGEIGSMFCRVLRMDLRTGALLAEQGPVSGQVGDRRPTECRHGGGLAMGEHGLWLAEKRRLWLLDPDTLATVRVWDNVSPVWGSVLLSDGKGRIGQVGFGHRRTSQLHWFDPDRLMSAGVLDITEDMAVRTQFAPRVAQGAFWAGLGGRERVWFIRSDTRCGILQGSQKQRYGFLPGAEGASYDGRRLWVVSESTSEPYWRKGGRPVVPQIARYDLRELEKWAEPTCSP